jgi:hypothetical protein
VCGGVCFAEAFICLYCFRNRRGIKSHLVLIILTRTKGFSLVWKHQYQLLFRDIKHLRIGIIGEFFTCEIKPKQSQRYHHCRWYHIFAEKVHQVCACSWSPLQQIFSPRLLPSLRGLTTVRTGSVVIRLTAIRGPAHDTDGKASIDTV